MIVPFMYMVGTSFKPPPEVISWPPTLWPENPTLENYASLRTAAPFGRFFLNSIIVAAVSTLGIISTSTLAGYIFSKFRFPGRNILFIILLSTAMVPFETYLIPLYLIARNLKLINTYAGLVGPYLIMSFGIFLMRQNIGSAIPDELLDAARIDGASEWRIFFSNYHPLIEISHQRPGNSGLYAGLGGLYLAPDFSHRTRDVYDGSGIIHFPTAFYHRIRQYYGRQYHQHCTHSDHLLDLEATHYSWNYAYRTERVT